MLISKKSMSFQAKIPKSYGTGLEAKGEITVYYLKIPLRVNPVLNNQLFVSEQSLYKQNSRSNGKSDTVHAT